MVRYSKPIDQMIQEAMNSLGGEATIQQVIDWLRSKYPNDSVKSSSISTAMSDLSVNGPSSSLYPIARRFLFRVGRGYYRIAEKENTASSVKKPQDKVKLNPSENLFRERDVQEILSKWFENKGHVVVQKCLDDPSSFNDIRKCKTSNVFGIDIVAQKGSEKWIVEVKGETRGGTASGNVDLMCAVGQLLTYMKKLDHNLHYAIAIPNTPHFANALEKLRRSMAITVLKLNLILVERNGTVKLKETSEFYMTKNSAHGEPYIPEF